MKRKLVVSYIRSIIEPLFGLTIIGSLFILLKLQKVTRKIFLNV